jgi:hypothetical protein
MSFQLLAKKILLFSMPTMLAGFIVYENVLPFLKSPKKIERGIASVAATPNTRLAKNLPDGRYYAFKANYQCNDSGLKRRVSSFVDSFEVKKGVICNLGDQCRKTAEKCSNEIPSGLQYNKKDSSFQFDKKSYRRLQQEIPPECPIASCAALPDICQFDQMPPLDAKGCPQGCGTIACKPESVECPVLKCAAPPQNCEYSGKAPTGADGCAAGCGELVCDIVDESKVLHCPDIKCKAPPENCSYDGSATYSANGCQATCGQVVCGSMNPKAVVCPSAPHCAAPPSGCFYAGEPEKDGNGCTIGCQSLVCPKQLAARCHQPPACAPPAPNCRYDGNSPLDFDGCSTGCGNLICSQDK